MKHTIRWLEEKIGKHDTNFLIFFIGEVGLMTGAYFFHYSNFWSILTLPSMFLLNWIFERVNKHSLKKGT